MKRLFLLPSILLLACFCFAEYITPQNDVPMMAASNSELYAYRYITELYKEGDSLNLSKEITQFKASYSEN